MNKQLSQVAQFMTTFGQNTRLEPTLIPMDEALLRVKMLKEEVQELEDAIVAGDIVEIADALTDIDYLQKGGIIQFGLSAYAEDLFDEVQRSNMSKLTKDGQVLRREDGKIMKSDQYSPPDLAKVLRNGMGEGNY